ncbi:MAG TPA: precorrin-6A reductase [Candidatus Blautia avistercoris]|nr:precorrin-6A reductase [Candidatus Blautia avistercoris]
MFKAVVFAGTTEGYEIARWLKDRGGNVCACVATEYGALSLEAGEGLQVKAGRLKEEEMEELFMQQDPAVVIDATHPYAVEVTRNIQDACRNTDRNYLRLLRAESQREEQAVYVENIKGAVEYLKETKGNILVTTGSKELSAFTELPDYQERVFARVLSLPSVIEECARLKIQGKHLIGMQGPFSRQLNEAMLRQYNCTYLVTKDSGTAGGFREKYEAALSCGAVPVVIGRPPRDEGLSLKECKSLLAKEKELKVCREIALVGVGMGSAETFTQEGLNQCRRAELIIGARRLAEAAKAAGGCGDVYWEYQSEKIIGYLKDHPEYTRIAIALSGDVGFYSGAKKLLQGLKEAFPQSPVRTVCGISSLVYFMGKIGKSWEDVCITSSHGRACNLPGLIRENQKVFSILGTRDGVRNLARKLTDYGMEDCRIWVGERLSYPEETIFEKKARELTAYEGDPLSVIYVENPKAEKRMETHGIADEAFLRGKAPMTKEEIRTISLAKLKLNRDSICYDVGAGTGSVAIEMALRASQGKVYAIEKKPEAAELIRENKKKFATDNLEVSEGEAPQALEPLEAPTHAFIGGSSGNLKAIVELLLRKNPQVRIVINCITLETVSEALEVLKTFPVEQEEIIQAVVSRAKKVGRYHMMMGENPIYIISCKGVEKG